MLKYFVTLLEYSWQCTSALLCFEEKASVVLLFNLYVLIGEIKIYSSLLLYLFQCVRSCKEFH